MSVSTPDEVALAGYFDLALTGLETLMFTDISGLSHSVPVQGAAVATSQGGTADARTIGTPAPTTLTMSHVVLTSMDLWTWADQTIQERAGSTTMKTGTLMIKALGTGEIQKTWNLSDVYLTGVTLDTIGGAGSNTYLTATVTILVGSCVPMS